MLITNPLIAYGVERPNRVEPVELAGAERVVAPEFNADALDSVGEQRTSRPATRVEPEQAESVIVVDVVAG